MTYPDGNTAALRQHEAEQDRLDKRHEAYGERIMQDVLDRLFDGKKVNGYSLHGFIEDGELTSEDLAPIFMAKDRDGVALAVSDATTKLCERIRAFFEEHEADYLADREREWDADARAEAQEWRGER